MSIRLIAVMVQMPSPPVVQVILGQTHFIKTTCLSILRERSPLVPEVQAIEVPLC
jgi:adenosine/AMP kinase